MVKQLVRMVILLVFVFPLLLGAILGCSAEKTADQYLGEGRDYLEKGEPSKAIAALEEALKRDAELAEAQRLIGEALKENGRWAEALDHFKIYQTLAGDDPAAYLSLGEAYAKTGDLEKAATAFSEAARLDPSYLEKHSEEISAAADTFLKAGRRALEEGDLAMATELLSAVAPLVPGQGELYVLLGQAQQQAGNTVQALTAYANAIELSPELVGQYAAEIEALAQQGIEQAEAAADSGELERAVETMQAVITLRPDESRPHFVLGNFYNEADQLLQAIEQYEAVLAIDPDNASALTNLGVVYYKMGDLDKAIATYQDALAVEPDDAETHYLLGAAYVQMERLAESKAEFDRAIELNDQLAPPYIGLANIQLLQGDLDAALQALEKAIELAPSSPEAYFALGQVYLQQGNIEEARTALEQVLTLNPAPHWRQQVENILQSLESE
jgi:protein O-GlcNAc transferase